MAVNCRFLFFLLALSGGYFVVSRAQDNRCEQGWQYYGGSCYFEEDRKDFMASWTDAQSVCQSKQANLVTVNDANEQKFLESLLGNHGSWLGLNNRRDLNVFEWVSGEQSSYTNWLSNPPAKDVNKRCAKIQEYTGHKWQMVNCDKKYRYTCEKAAPPLPCESNPCKNGGTCIEQGDGYLCQCPDRFTGKQCETEIPLNPCDPDPCQNGGNCYDIGSGEHYCLCQNGFSGKNCEIIPRCSSYPCKNGGKCVELGNNVICKCPSGYTGSICQGQIPYITKDPEDAVRMAGDSVTLCCEAKGLPAPTYEWLRDNVPLNQPSKTLRLTSLSAGNAGLYKCRATNEYGKAVSSEAKLTVITGGGADSCNPTPLRKMQTLPPGCTEDSSGSNQVNVGTCSYEECIKRGEGDSGQCGEAAKSKSRHCCSPSKMVNSPVSCGNGVKFNVEKVSGCLCSECVVPDMIVRGRAVDPDGNPLKQGKISVEGDKTKYLTDLSGYFNIPVKAGTKRLVLTITDKLVGQLQETTKALTLHEGQVSFYIIELQKKPPPIKFSAIQPKKISLGTPGKPTFVDVDIPARAFLTPDGNVYDGEITANVGVVDPRSESDMAAAPGDFSTIDDDGEEVLLGTAGILRPSFTDSSGNKLNLDRNLTIKMDADQLDIPDGVTVYQYYLSKTTGRWVKFGVLRPEIEALSSKRQAPRKFFVSDITPNVPYDTINWDYPQTQSIVRIRAPAGTVVTRIHLSDNGQSFTSYRQETVPPSEILCMRNLLNRRTVIQAERDGSPLVPQQPSNFPSAVNAEIISGSSASNPFKIQSFRFISTNVGDPGPVYGLRETGRCQQQRSGDFAFEFQEAGAGEVFHWESPREENPNSNIYWRARAPDICFVKALVSGSKPDSVIYVKSTGKAPNSPVLDYGYTAEKSEIVGNQGVVCLEYRCNQGAPSTYQTHLQFLSLTGRCTIQRLNNILTQRQSSCPVRPDSPSSIGGQELNICAPVDLQGGDAGLYTGDSGVAKFRCLTGDNNYSQGRPQTTSRNPTVELTCN